MVPQKLRPHEQHLLNLIPDETKLGPGMQALSERHRCFVGALVMQGGKLDFTKAARAAGYEAKPESLRVIAHRLAHSEDIQAAIQEEARRRVRTSSLAATAMLDEILANPETETRDRLMAIRMVMERTEPATTEHKVSVERRDLTRPQVIAQLRELIVEAGGDPRKFIGNLADTTDADFKVLDACERGDGPWLPVPDYYVPNEGKQ
jgi:phage terminase small subunit